MFGIDGVIIGLIITFVCLFAGILSGFPVAFGRESCADVRGDCLKVG